MAAKEEFADLGSVFFVLATGHLGIWAGGRTAGGLLYNTKFCIGTGKISFFFGLVFLIC